MAGVRRWKRERDDDAAADEYELNDGSDDESRDGDRCERLEDLFDLAPHDSRCLRRARRLGQIKLSG